MGLYIQTLDSIPVDANKQYFIYRLDYGWTESLSDVMMRNFNKMAVKFYFNVGWDDTAAQSFLLSQYHSMASKNGVNNWEAVVYLTLSENLPLIRSL